jgi:hypothetical protein
VDGRRASVAYGYQYIPTTARDERRVRASAVRVMGGGRVYRLDRTTAAIAEAIAAVYRDIDDLRSTVPDLVPARADDHATEAETAG